MAYEDEITTITVKIITRDELAALGAKGDSYDDIIQKLLKERRDRLKK